MTSHDFHKRFVAFLRRHPMTVTGDDEDCTEFHNRVAAFFAAQPAEIGTVYMVHGPDCSAIEEVHNLAAALAKNLQVPVVVGVLHGIDDNEIMSVRPDLPDGEAAVEWYYRAAKEQLH